MRRSPEQQVLLILSWPSPFALRLVISVWKSQRALGHTCRVLDLTSLMNRFCMKNSIKVGTPFFSIKKHLLFIQALRFGVFFLYWSIWQTKLQVTLDNLRGHHATQTDLSEELLQQYDQGVLNSLSDLNEQKDTATKIVSQDLRMFEKKIRRRISRSLTEVSKWYTFSGRFPIDMFFWRLSTVFDKHKDIFFVEVGRAPHSRVISPNLFSETSYRNLIDENWELRSPAHRSLIREYFRKRLSEHTDAQFYGEQALIEKFELFGNPRVCTFFLSSLSEFLPHVMKSHNLPFPSQESVLEWLVETISSRDIVLVVRDHPRTSSHCNIDQSAIDKAQCKLAERFLYINGKIPVSSKAIIRASNYCVTFGSSVGVDIVLLQKPLLCLGPNVLFSSDMSHAERLKFNSFFDEPKQFIYNRSHLESFALFEMIGGESLGLQKDMFH
jgi:hypothetical protein